MDARVLERYLAGRVAGGQQVTVSGLSRFPVGASRETWSFDASWVSGGEATSAGLILRRDADGGPIDVDLHHEYEVYRALAGSGVPVPTACLYEPDETPLGRPFYLMERIDGCESSPQVIVHGPAFAGARGKLGGRFVEILATLHGLDVGAPAFAFLPRPALEDAAQAQLDYWAGVLDGIRLGPQPLARGILQWLREHLPTPPGRLALLHGDPRTGNYLATPEGEIRALLDWELAHIGDPLEDLGYALMNTWTFGTGSRVSGLLEREDFLSRYGELTGMPLVPETLRFWEVFSNFKAVMIQLTGAQAFVDGRTASMTMLQFGRGARSFALAALDRMEVPGVPA